MKLLKAAFAAKRVAKASSSSFPSQYLSKGVKMKKVYQVEIKGQKQKYTFDDKQQAEDYAFVISAFGGKQYSIKVIYINEEAKV
jgi:hypothetical protein